jgi:hypothetical protein
MQPVGDGKWHIASNKLVVWANLYKQQQLVLALHTNATTTFCINFKKGEPGWDLLASPEAHNLLVDFFMPATATIWLLADNDCHWLYMQFKNKFLKNHGGWVEEGYTFFIGQCLPQHQTQKRL